MMETIFDPAALVIIKLFVTVARVMIKAICDRSSGFNRKNL